MDSEKNETEQLEAREPMTDLARRHRRLIFILMLIFCTLPLILLFLKMAGEE